MRLLVLAAVMVAFHGHAIAMQIATLTTARTAAPVALTADQIMAKVAANQDHSETARTRYVYLQHIRMVSRRPGGKVMCEETTDSRVSPQQKESQQQLLTVDGRYWHKGQYVHYDKLQDNEATEPQEKQAKTEQEDLEGMDIDLVENLRKNLTDDKSKDGLGRACFR